jgi:cysteine synthase A
VVGVDAEGSVVLGGKGGRRLIPGHGAALRPALCDLQAIDRCIKVSDVDCIVGCRRLVREEAILAGGSSGGVVMAFESLRDEIPSGSSCVLILPDRGERYLDTIYDDDWVEAHFGDLSHLWDSSATAEPPRHEDWDGLSLAR